MPTIYVMSDIHLEFNPKEVEFTKADILVLPGDISVVTEKEDGYRFFLKEMKRQYKHVVFVAGNHEYYKCDYDRKTVDEKLQALAIETGTNFLNRSSVVIEGIEFIGCTLWSRLGKFAEPLISDFQAKVFPERKEYLEAFETDYKFLKEALSKPAECTRIVVTHHLPTSELIHNRFRGSIVNSGFYTEVARDFNLYDVKFWFCGHTHEYSECIIGTTMFLANPLGYPDEKRQTQISKNLLEI